MCVDSVLHICSVFDIGICSMNNSIKFNIFVVLETRILYPSFFFLQSLPTNKNYRCISIFFVFMLIILILKKISIIHRFLFIMKKHCFHSFLKHNFIYIAKAKVIILWYLLNSCIKKKRKIERNESS